MIAPRVMSGRTVAVAALLALAMVGCGSGSSPEDGVFAAYGTSYISGIEPTYPHPWVEQAAREMGLPLVDRGVSGSLSAETLQAVEETWPRHPRRGGVVAVECELNDLRGYGLAGLSAYESHLRAILRLLTTSTPRPRVVVVLEPPIQEWNALPPFDHGSVQVERAYNAASHRIAVAFGALVADPSPGWNPATMISSDGIHPSPAGAAQIAKTVTGRLHRP